MVDKNPDPEFGRASATEDAEPEGIDLERVREIAGFILRAGRRRPKLTTLMFLMVATVGLLVAAFMPNSYVVQVKILAQTSGVLRALSAPNSALQRVDDPTKNVRNLILRRDNLAALVKQANLGDRFEESRAPLLRLKDRFMTWMYGPASDADKQQVLVAMLEQKLDIATDGDTLVIGVDWPTAQMAYDLVTLVQKNFLEARYDSDLAAITEGISVLEDHAKAETAQVEVALKEYETSTAAAAASAAIPLQPGSRASVETGASSGPRQDVAPKADGAASLALEETRLRIRALEQERQRLLDSLKQQLSEAQLTLTPLHPTVVALQRRLDAMGQPSAELGRLKSEERALMEQVDSAPAVSETGDTASTLRVHRAGPGTIDRPVPMPPFAQQRGAAEDGPSRLARSKLGLAFQSYESAMARIDDANVELDITRTAYKHRYTVITPAELPNKPKKQRAQLIAVGSILSAALLAFLSAAIADTLGGKILEPWQVRRKLKLEILGELDRSA